jgi:hypothetical protein
VDERRRFAPGGRQSPRIEAVSLHAFRVRHQTA